MRGAFCADALRLLTGEFYRLEHAYRTAIVEQFHNRVIKTSRRSKQITISDFCELSRWYIYRPQRALCGVKRRCRVNGQTTYMVRSTVVSVVNCGVQRLGPWDLPADPAEHIIRPLGVRDIPAFL
jgi:hypothetical protein